MNEVIEKFMDGMGITYNIELTRSQIYGGKPYVCYVVYANYKGNTEYEQHHCYSKRDRDGAIIYEEGNQIKGPGRGIFAYITMDGDVHRYFENKTRNKAKEYLSDI